MCERELSDIDSISILGFEREYLDGLLEVAAQRRAGQHLLVLFLGSTIGNFDRPAGIQFLAEVRRILQPGDSLLLGTDLLKSSSQLLARLRRRTRSDRGFQSESAGCASIANSTPISISRNSSTSPRSMTPSAAWKCTCVRSAARPSIFQTAGLSVELLEGETIWTESSHKYSPEEIFEMARTTGFRCDAQWIDHQWPFAENLLIAE